MKNDLITKKNDRHTLLAWKLH